MKLFAHTYGSGRPLIILHGLFGSLDNWHSLSKRFADHFRVYAVDQRNHGRSPHSDVFSYEVMADDLLEFFGENGLGEAFVLGHSMGGKTAMEFALGHPERVAKLVVVDIAPREYAPHHDVLFEALCSVDLTAYRTRREVDDALADRIPSVPVRMFLMKNLKRSEDGTLSWKMNLPVLRARYDEVNRALRPGRVYSGPSLFIRAEASPYVAASDLSLILSLFPKAQMVDFDTGHWVHAESPDPFYRTVTEFLAGSP